MQGGESIYGIRSLVSKKVGGGYIHGSAYM